MTTTKTANHAVTIRRAAIDAIARRLDDFPENGDLEDIWERNPQLTQNEANLTLLVAQDVARLARDIIAFMGALANVGSAETGTGRG